MFLKASEDHSITLKSSLMIGDSVCDVEAAQRCNMESMLVLTGNGKKAKKSPNISPTFIEENLLTASIFLSGIK